jgi:hypothetical protein
MVSTSLLVAADACLASRCLAMDIFALLLQLHTFGVQASCHIINRERPVEINGKQNVSKIQ